MAKTWFIGVALIAALLTTDIKKFQGAKQLAESIRESDEELLVYANNGNDLGLLEKDGFSLFSLDTNLLVPGGCCAHRATPSLSQDGRQLAYVSLSSSQPRKEAVNIYDLSTRVGRRVFEAEVIWSVSWAPDGNRLAIIADRATDQEHNPYIVDVTSNAFKQLTHLTLGGRSYAVSGHAHPSWNTDSTQLAVEMQAVTENAQSGTATAIVLWNVQMNEFHKLADGVDPSWSPSGDEIAFFEPSRRKCFTVRPDGSHKKLFFAVGKRPFGLSSAPLFYPVVWSPDGKHLLFHQWVDADIVSNVYELDLTTGRPKFLSRTELQVVNWRKKIGT